LFVSVAAQGVNDPTPPTGEVSNEKLEQVWAHQLKAYERTGKTDEFVAKVQKLLDRATANSKDVSAVQAALNAFIESTKDARPIYESAKGIINSHHLICDHHLIFPCTILVGFARRSLLPQKPVCLESNFLQTKI